MTEPNDSTTAAVAVALAELRGTMETGFATVNGSLALLAQRTDQTDRRLDDHEARLDANERGETERQKRDAARLDALERARWPIPSVAAAVGVAGLAVSLWR
ncbi:hypothetical protein ACWCO9_19535 [Streptomyces sp. NPDC001937]